ncbi:Exodeoxyribonuclease VII small subunit [Arachidicoccus rhizosphaerae]|uniref:Exodeoxyribonuclease VII small subunit n=1 Tax=Arachidicoccus rhizosphaerae TaxID=551991 RepID=A0A1H4BDI9_9BACT|nr:exodeoxyribonuclease VII small subunit [Arachidicoccus rhizosphaerae]SEA46201.1 Exodeoxyribonuclease VII small subunit [Arachidicoccus rhizosphaerae]
MEQNLTYSAAYAELENIAQAMENDSISIDELAVKVKRAAELIEFCQNKLRSTEKEVATVMSSMEEGKSHPLSK